MKTATIYPRYHTAPRPVAFPNAASNREILHKLLDKLLLCASAVGVTVTILMILVLL